MAQSALTVTVANPTPPTNFSFVGNTPPLDPAQPAVDDGTAGSLVVFAAKTAASSTGGAPGAGISFDHEGKGTEVTVTAPGSLATAPTIAFSDLGNYTWLGTTPPNAQHASSLSTAGTSTLSAASGASNASGVGTTLLTATGTNFRRDSVITLNGIPQTTNYVSATSLTVTNALKRTTAGTLPVTVTTGGVTTAPTNWVFT
jgi:IPT/TIG domain